MARTRGTRKSSNGLFTMLWGPVKHLFQFSGESAQKLGSTAGKIVKESFKGVEGVGSSLARHSNQAVGGITRGVGRAVKGVKRAAKSITRKRRAGRR